MGNETGAVIDEKKLLRDIIKNLEKKVTDKDKTIEEHKYHQLSSTHRILKDDYIKTLEQMRDGLDKEIEELKDKNIQLEDKNKSAWSSHESMKEQLEESKAELYKVEMREGELSNKLGDAERELKEYKWNNKDLTDKLNGQVDHNIAMTKELDIEREKAIETPSCFGNCRIDGLCYLTHTIVEKCMWEKMCGEKKALEDLLKERSLEQSDR